MVGDYKQAIFGFQGTDPQEFERFRATVAGRAGAARRRSRRSRGPSPRIPRPVDQRQLPFVAGGARSGRCADRRGRSSAQWACRQPPEPHEPFHADRPGRVELWPAYDPPVDRPMRSEEGEEGWIDEPTRLYADAIARQVRRWLAEAPVMATTGRPLTAGDILILVRSRGGAGLADRRPALRPGRAGGRHRPAAPAQAAGGQGSARRGRLRGSAARRPQSRQPAGFAADRLGPGAALRPGAGPRRASCGPNCSAGARSGTILPTPTPSCRTGWRWPIMSLRRASWRRSCRARLAAGASCFGGSARRRAIRSRSWSQARLRSRARKSRRSTASSPGSGRAMSR